MLVYTKTVDSVEVTLLLVTQTPNILYNLSSSNSSNICTEKNIAIAGVNELKPTFWTLHAENAIHLSVGS